MYTSDDCGNSDEGFVGEGKKIIMKKEKGCKGKSAQHDYGR